MQMSPTKSTSQSLTSQCSKVPQVSQRTKTLRRACDSLITSSTSSRVLPLNKSRKASSPRISVCAQSHTTTLPVEKPKLHAKVSLFQNHSQHLLYYFEKHYFIHLTHFLHTKTDNFTFHFLSCRLFIVLVYKLY